MQKWISESDPHKVRRLGKSLEELGELVAVLARCLIQGADEVDPSSGVRNLQRMQDEIADVNTQLKLTARSYLLDVGAMEKRSGEKEAQMKVWEKHYRHFLKVNVNLYKGGGKWAYGGVVEVDTRIPAFTKEHRQNLVDAQDFVVDGTFEHYLVVVTHCDDYETDPTTYFCQATYFPNDGAFTGMRKGGGKREVA